MICEPIIREVELPGAEARGHGAPVTMMAIMRARMDATRLPVTLRAALGLAMVVGLLTLCHAAFSTGAAEPPVTVAAASALTVDDGAPAVLAVASDAPSGEGLSGDCALLIACTVALLALGAMLMLRASRSDRVLWQLLVPVRRCDGVPSRHQTLAVFVREPAALVC